MSLQVSFFAFCCPQLFRGEKLVLPRGEPGFRFVVALIEQQKHELLQIARALAPLAQKHKDADPRIAQAAKFIKIRTCNVSVNANLEPLSRNLERAVGVTTGRCRLPLSCAPCQNLNGKTTDSCYVSDHSKCT